VFPLQSAFVEQVWQVWVAVLQVPVVQSEVSRQATQA
jgi:hypothetical protein